MSAAGNGPGEDVHQGARHLNPDGADDDPLDPLLGLQDRLGLNGEHLPDEGLTFQSANGRTYVKEILSDERRMFQSTNRRTYVEEIFQMNV